MKTITQIAREEDIQALRMILRRQYRRQRIASRIFRYATPALAAALALSLVWWVI